MISTRPSVLFVCKKNGGKSQMAAALMRLHAGEQIEVLSAGTAPGTAMNQDSVASVLEVGGSFEGESIKGIEPQWLDQVDRVVVLGGEAHIENPGLSPVERWETDEPSERGVEGIERMRLIRDDIDARVLALKDQLLG
ncbi:MAG: low molecular weight phosphatase family protein [Ornithinimicrobium sp.]